MKQERELPNVSVESVPNILAVVMIALHKVTQHWILANLTVAAAFFVASFLLSLAEAGCLLVLCAIYVEIMKQVASKFRENYVFIREQAVNGAFNKSVNSEGGQTTVRHLNEAIKVQIDDVEQRFGWVERTYISLWAWDLLLVLIGTFFWGFGERLWPS